MGRTSLADSGLLPARHLDAASRLTARTPKSSRPTSSGDGPLGRADAHVDERPLGGEHDAEDDQDQRAADVDEQLRGADEVGAEQEEDARRARQGEQQPGRGADDVLRHHDGDGADAGQGGEDVEQDVA